jgi:hypothetical protein
MKHKRALPFYDYEDLERLPKYTFSEFLACFQRTLQIFFVFVWYPSFEME